MSVILDELYKLGGSIHEGSYVWRLIRNKRPDSVTTATPDKLELRNQTSAESKQRAALGPWLIYVERLVGQLLSEIFFGSWRGAAPF